MLCRHRPLSKTSNALVFEGGCYLPPTPPHHLENEYTPSFSRVVALCRRRHPPTSKTSICTRFRGCLLHGPPRQLSYLENVHPHFILFMYIYNSLMYIIINYVITYIYILGKTQQNLAKNLYCILHRGCCSPKLPQDTPTSCNIPILVF